MGTTVEFHCHECDHKFTITVDNEYGTYEFVRCPHCESAMTTLA